MKSIVASAFFSLALLASGVHASPVAPQKYSTYNEIGFEVDLELSQGGKAVYKASLNGMELPAFDGTWSQNDKGVAVVNVQVNGLAVEMTLEAVDQLPPPGESCKSLAGLKPITVTHNGDKVNENRYYLWPASDVSKAKTDKANPGFPCMG